MGKRKKILVLYDYFLPAMQGGGPTVSLINLTDFLREKYDFYVFSTNKDLDGSLLKVEPDVWISYKEGVKVQYGYKNWNFKGLKNILQDIKPDIIYVNGIYSLVPVIYPLLINYRTHDKPRIVVCPRGMLLKNAVNEKKVKKKIYLFLLGLLIKRIKLFWHVTSTQEKAELLELFPYIASNGVFTIGNIPNTEINLINRRKKSMGMRLLTIAIISPMKNYLKIIKALKKVTEQVTYSIYGNIKDEEYWRKCVKELDGLPENIKIEYKGLLRPDELKRVLESHDIYIQPSKSENFSHSIFEALSSGMPVVTSYNTPWNLNTSKAGWNVNPDNENEMVNVITHATCLSNHEYHKISMNARKVSERYLNDQNLKISYSAMFD